MADNGVSIIICCHNSAGRLPETLLHLQRQKVSPEINWEVIVVDNASVDTTADDAILLWGCKSPASLRVIHEPRLGVGNARLRGLRKARYEFVSFIDDDNHPAADWITNVYAVMTSNPHIGACGGSVEAVFESALPFWFNEVKRAFVIGEQYERAGVLPAGKVLWGAGLTIRKSVWQSLLARGYSLFLSGRKGRQQTAGEDSEICYALYLSGCSLYYSPDLRLQHFLPAGRLTWKNTCRMYRGFGRSKVILSRYFALLQSKKTGGHYRGAGFFRQTLYNSFNLLRRPMLLGAAVFSKQEGNTRILDMQQNIGWLLEAAALLHRIHRIDSQLKNWFSDR